MSEERRQPSVVVLCTVKTGLDSIAELLRNGFTVKAIIGVDPNVADPNLISGYTDVAQFGLKWGIPNFYATRYDLKSETDRELFSTLDFDLIWVAGWQRLIPDWLINQAPLGALGGHGSPDGIHGGRGRSPQNWAIMLGCKRFDIALFRITPGIDDGPVVTQRSFYYNESDDISISYKKSALCVSEMMIEVLSNPTLIKHAVPQSYKVSYYPQRKPEDGYADWNLSLREVWAYCRALTRPYPGLKTRYGDVEITIWECLPFDDEVRSLPGTIDFVFEDGCFLVSCRDGRIIVRDYSVQGEWKPSSNILLTSQELAVTMKGVLCRYLNKYPEIKIAKRVLNVASY